MQHLFVRQPAYQFQVPYLSGLVMVFHNNSHVKIKQKKEGRQKITWICVVKWLANKYTCTKSKTFFHQFTKPLQFGVTSQKKLCLRLYLCQKLPFPYFRPVILISPPNYQKFFTLSLVLISPPDDRSNSNRELFF